MTTLLNVPITTAGAGLVGSVLQLRAKSGDAFGNMAVQAVFTYGSGGTTAKAWLQTSLDGGTVWCDVTAHAFLLANKKSLFNLSPLTPKTTVFTAFTDGALADDTSVDGIFGSLWRVKYTTTGTYAGGTTLRVDAICATGLTAQT